MKSLKELYQIGPGPSSSHTLAPKKACDLFLEKNGECTSYKVDLYGTLSLTGKGHFTDQIFLDSLGKEKTEVNFYIDWNEEYPNGFYLSGYNDQKELVCLWTVFSLGGGSIKIKELPYEDKKDYYQEKSFVEIYNLCKSMGWTLSDYVENQEPDIKEYLNKILQTMISSVDRGLSSNGILPGSLKIKRVAKSLHLQATAIHDREEKNKLLLMAYAYAASEENASKGEVVTAPTFGASGVMAALMYYYYTDVGISKSKLVQALMVGGVFGNLIKENATISGSIGGCQAEIGTACSMGAAACAYLNGLNMKEIEYAAEIGIEHHLGLTCDPVLGYVIIPCIERNAVAALRAQDACLLAKYMTKLKGPQISFDMVVKTMNYTGEKIIPELRETSIGGLAKEYDHKVLNEEEIELDDHLVFDEVVLDDNEEPASPIKFKL